MADPGFGIDELQNLKRMLEQMYNVHRQSNKIGEYAKEQVANKEGFGDSLCLLHPFAGAMDELRTAIDDMTSMFGSRYVALQGAVRSAGLDYDLTDGHVSDLFVVKKG